MTSRRARRVSERRLESENINSTLNGVRRMAVPQLVWVDVEPGVINWVNADLVTHIVPTA